MELKITERCDLQFYLNKIEFFLTNYIVTSINFFHKSKQLYSIFIFQKIIFSTHCRLTDCKVFGFCQLFAIFSVSLIF